MAEAIAIKRTPPAATSLAISISLSLSGLILSASLSIAVLKDSAENTPPIHKMIRHHSTPVKPTKDPNNITAIAAAK